MFYTFEGIQNELKKNSENKIEYCVYGTYTGYTIYDVYNSICIKYFI